MVPTIIWDNLVQIVLEEHRYIPRKIRETIEIQKHPNFDAEEGGVLPAYTAWYQHCKTSRYQFIVYDLGQNKQLEVFRVAMVKYEIWTSF